MDASGAIKGTLSDSKIGSTKPDETYLVLLAFSRQLNDDQKKVLAGQIRQSIPQIEVNALPQDQSANLKTTAQAWYVLLTHLDPNSENNNKNVIQSKYCPNLKPVVENCEQYLEREFEQQLLHLCYSIEPLPDSCNDRAKYVGLALKHGFKSDQSAGDLAVPEPPDIETSVTAQLFVNLVRCHRGTPFDELVTQRKNGDLGTGGTGPGSGAGIPSYNCVESKPHTDAAAAAAADNNTKTNTGTNTGTGTADTDAAALVSVTVGEAFAAVVAAAAQDTLNKAIDTFVQGDTAAIQDQLLAVPFQTYLNSQSGEKPATEDAAALTLYANKRLKALKALCGVIDVKYANLVRGQNPSIETAKALLDQKAKLLVQEANNLSAHSDLNFLTEAFYIKQQDPENPSQNKKDIRPGALLELMLGLIEEGRGVNQVDNPPDYLETFKKKLAQAQPESTNTPEKSPLLFGPKYDSEWAVLRLHCGIAKCAAIASKFTSNIEDSKRLLEAPSKGDLRKFTKDRSNFVQGIQLINAQRETLRKVNWGELEEAELSPLLRLANREPGDVTLEWALEVAWLDPINGDPNKHELYRIAEVTKHLGRQYNLAVFENQSSEGGRKANLIKASSFLMEQIKNAKVDNNSPAQKQIKELKKPDGFCRQLTDPKSVAEVVSKNMLLSQGLASVVMTYHVGKVPSGKTNTSQRFVSFDYKGTVDKKKAKPEDLASKQFNGLAKNLLNRLEEVARAMPEVLKESPLINPPVNLQQKADSGEVSHYDLVLLANQIVSAVPESYRVILGDQMTALLSKAALWEEAYTFGAGNSEVNFNSKQLLQDYKYVVQQYQNLVIKPQARLDAVRNNPAELTVLTSELNELSREASAFIHQERKRSVHSWIITIKDWVQRSNSGVRIAQVWSSGVRNGFAASLFAGVLPTQGDQTEPMPFDLGLFKKMLVLYYQLRDTPGRSDDENKVFEALDKVLPQSFTQRGREKDYSQKISLLLSSNEPQFDRQLCRDLAGSYAGQLSKVPLAQSSLQDGAQSLLQNESKKARLLKLDADGLHTADADPLAVPKDFFNASAVANNMVQHEFGSFELAKALNQMSELKAQSPATLLKDKAEKSHSGSVFLLKAVKTSAATHQINASHLTRIDTIPKVLAKKTKEEAGIQKSLDQLVRLLALRSNSTDQQFDLAAQAQIRCASESLKETELALRVDRYNRLKQATAAGKSALTQSQILQSISPLKLRETTTSEIDQMIENLKVLVQHFDNLSNWDWDKIKADLRLIYPAVSEADGTASDQVAKLTEANLEELKKTHKSQQAESKQPETDLILSRFLGFTLAQLKKVEGSLDATETSQPGDDHTILDTEDSFKTAKGSEFEPQHPPNRPA